MPCRLFYCHLASQLNLKSFEQVIDFCISTPKKKVKAKHSFLDRIFLNQILVL